MKLEGDVEQRLACSIQAALYWIVRAPDPICVEESANDGRAMVYFDAGATCVVWRIEGKSVFGFLRETKNADGAFFVLRGDDAVEAHVVECKRTVTQAAWSKAKLQMRWTLLRLYALAGVLGLTIERVRCYTAYCDDEIHPDSSAKPTAGKIMTGEEDDAPAPEDAEDIEARRRIFDWDAEQVHLRDFQAPVPHRKLLLELRDGVGVGGFPIAT